MIESIASLMLATTLLLGSPGPVPIALAATGATFGIKQGTPFLMGILLGLLVAIIGTTLGLSTLLSVYPNVKVICQTIGGLYICFIAYKIATAPLVIDKEIHHAPSFQDGFILNLINPKAYAAFLAIFSQFLLPFELSWISYISTGLICMLIAMVVDSLWLMFGRLIKPLFTHPRQARIIRVSFALLMVLSVIYSQYL
ncbi:LysE family translocator [Shewanella goraebulensis]|uniref:LysE family translocator n=1 Tax=Shewanella goraebulensis TaxID=3050637 RepID=UPI00254F59F8|nr:LysE family translocator [Shewanella goraebulensis]